jgi:hypothetical protein
MLNLIKHSILIAICLWILQNINAISVLPFFVFSLDISFYSFIKDKKELATRYPICRYTRLKCVLSFVLSTLGLLELYSFSSFFFISS